MKKNILSKVVLTTFITSMVLTTGVFADTTVTNTEVGKVAVEASKEDAAEISVLRNEKSDYVIYKGTVTSIEEGEDGYISVLVSETGLKANIADDAVVIDAKDGSVKKVSDIKDDMDIMLVIGANTPMTMSIPPMTSSVSSVIINTDSNVDFSVYNSELINAENNLKLNIGKDTVIINAKGEKAKEEELEGSALAVFYGASTRSIPAQTTPETVMIIEKAKNEVVDKSPVKLREVSEKAGYSVKWIANDMPVELKKEDKTILVTAESNICTINGVKTELSGKIYLEDETMMAPYDFAELL
ncbi:copper amine oxidase N-terminal domain-containing protein [Lachnospiraceae bacterium NSJ-143]|nr:copper amine oxidase N-terminal domain-containing protein [Lachnospiraceae bacterium NSJ-143]